MPIPVDYFQPMSFQQANPFLSGLQSGQQIYAQGMQNAYLPQTLQQQLQKMQLGNQQLGIQNQYLPQDMQSQIALKNAQTGLTQQQTQNELNYPLKGDLPGNLEYLTQVGKQYGSNSPQYQQAQGALNAQIDMLRNRAAFFGANLALKNVPTAEKNAMIGSGYQPGTIAYSGTNNQPTNAQQPVQSQVQPQAQAQTSNSGAPQNYDYPTVQKTAQIATNQALTTGAQKNRLQAGSALENFVSSPSSQQALNTLANYSGIQGRLKAQVQRFTDPNAYLQYQNATEQFPTIIAGGLKVLEGYPSTDQAVQRVTNYFTAAQNLVKTDPSAAYAYFQQGLQYIRDENAAVQNINQPIFKTGNIYGPQNSNNATANNAASNLSNSKVLNGKTYTKINGQWYQQ